MYCAFPVQVLLLSFHGIAFSKQSWKGNYTCFFTLRMSDMFWDFNAYMLRETCLYLVSISFSQCSIGPSTIQNKSKKEMETCKFISFKSWGHYFSFKQCSIFWSTDYAARKQNLNFLTFSGLYVFDEIWPILNEWIWEVIE